MRPRDPHLLLLLALGVLVCFCTGCSTIDLERSLFEAGRDHRRRQWELEENRPAIDADRVRFEDYEEARRQRLAEPG